MKATAAKAIETLDDLRARRDAVDAELNMLHEGGPNEPKHAKIVREYEEALAQHQAHIANLRRQRDLVSREMLLATAPDQADEGFVARADAAIAEHEAKIGELTAQRDALDAQFKVTTRENAEARASARKAAIEATVKRIMAREEARLSNIERAEAAARALFQHLKDAVSASEGIYEESKTLGVVARSDFDRNAQTERLSKLWSLLAHAEVGSTSGCSFGNYCTWRKPAVNPRGPVMPAASLVKDWRGSEEQYMAPVIQQALALLETGQ